MLISTFDAPTDPTPAHVEVADLRALSEALPHERRASKHGVLWSPAQYIEGRGRAKANVLAVHLLALDVDSIDLDALCALIETLDGLGLERWVHSTWGHSWTAPKVRVVLSLSRPVLAAEWPSFWATATRELCPSVDPATKDASRIFYPPACPLGTADEDTIHDYRHGAPLDVDEVLSLAVAAGVAPAPDLPPAQGEPFQVTDRMREASQRRAESLARRIRTFPQGSGIYAVVRDAAYELGGRVAAGALSLAVARSELCAAHRHRNPNPERVREKDALVDRALAEGAARPWCPSGWYPTTDDGLAGELAENHASAIRYVDTWGKWIGWDGTSWSEHTAEMALGEAVRSFGAAMATEAEYATEAREKALRRASNHIASATGYRNLVYMTRLQPKVRVRHSDLDGDPWILATPKGAIDLRTGHTHEHDSTRLTMGCTSAHPDAAHPCPTWRDFLRDLTMGDREVEAFLQRAIGYSITGHVEPHALFLLTGGGGNGKGVFIRAIKHALGTYAISASPHLLLQKKSDQHATGIADLHRKRIATISEVEEGKGWDEVELKALVDSDNIRARRMREDSWEFDPTHHFWVSGNYLPHVRGVDNGVWRRLFLIPCGASKVDLEDLVMQEKMEAEAPGILAWAIEGCLDWQRHKRRLDPTPSMIAAKATYRDDSDPVGQFVTERCDVAAEHEELASRLLEAYCQWAGRNGQHNQPTAQFLGRRLERFAKPFRNKSGARAWSGIRLRSPATATLLPRSN